MNYKISTLSVIAIAASIFAVEFEKQEIDKFTGVKQYKTVPLIANKKLALEDKTVFADFSFYLEYKDSLNILSISYLLKDAKTAPLTMVPFNKDNATLLFADGSNAIIQLATIKPDQVIDGVLVGMKAKVTHHFNIPVDLVDRLKTTKVTDIRFKATYGGFDYAVTPENQVALLDLFQVLSKDVVPFKLEMPAMPSMPQAQ